MDYSKQVEVLIEQIAIFAIKTKNLAPKSIMYNFERTRLMEAALALQVAGRSIDTRLYNDLTVPKVEIEDFKHEWKRVEGTLSTLLLQLEVEVRYSQGQRTNANSNAMLPLPGPRAFPTAQLGPSPQGSTVVLGGVQQRSAPATLVSAANPGPNSLSPDSLCMCENCAAILCQPSTPRSGQSSPCSCENCSPWLYSPLPLSSDSGFESAGSTRNKEE